MTVDGSPWTPSTNQPPETVEGEAARYRGRLTGAHVCGQILG